jgi:hypothetical protein
MNIGPAFDNIEMIPSQHLRKAERGRGYTKARKGEGRLKLLLLAL